MPSTSHVAFLRALIDVDNLMEFHEKAGGVARGRRAKRLQSLNKSAVVLLCAAWESYIESVIRECATQNIAGAETPAQMRKSLRKLVASHVKNSEHELSWESVTGDAWRDVARSMVTNKTALLNTPKRTQVNDLFRSVLGIKDIEQTWAWHKNPLGTPAVRLDNFVALRGSIAHGDVQEKSVTKAHVSAARELLERLVDKVEERLTNENLLAP